MFYGVVNIKYWQLFIKGGAVWEDIECAPPVLFPR